MDCTTRRNWNDYIQVLINWLATLHMHRLSIMFVYRYAFVDRYNAFWPDQATDTVNDGN